MNRHERAQYLVNIQSLMDSQVATGNLASSTLRSEYDREFIKLKEEIANETGSSNQQHLRTKD